MNVKILHVEKDELANATIVDGKRIALPSIHTGWRFNFDKHSQKLAHAKTYVLLSDQATENIEGCLIFQMLDKKIPYMAFVEVAPHNRQEPKRYDYVAGCLIAFAFQQSVLRGKDEFKAQLFFDVQEENKENEQKLIQQYCSRYGALHISGTTLVIIDEAGYKLIEKYLERKYKG